ncbi:hypothetical protein SNA_01300 [Streptomyces natalensis ATCC 27448]|uniref:Uncharacterized protein n=1 Tax=Streptomyces natalensis ATCC 27448 TaxID=1240678 RepID=A0A0D7CTP8_9ACTN|nr:hypothetical protein SNA_01300 [Streptomyces natalensis ATCC 27448]
MRSSSAAGTPATSVVGPVTVTAGFPGAPSRSASRRSSAMTSAVPGTVPASARASSRRVSQSVRIESAASAIAA